MIKMAKIPKDLSDKDMFKDYKEDKNQKSLFDVAKEFDENHAVKSINKPSKKDSDSFIDSHLANALNNELLKLKLDLYKDGIIDYKINLRRDGDQIVLYPVKKKSST